MEAVRISPKFQVVIPREVREKLHLVPGQRMQVVAYGNRIELIPERDLTEMRGFLKGIDTAVEREEDRL
jgi:AbrB family looped-hinge helix DNA binding protein